MRTPLLNFELISRVLATRRLFLYSFSSRSHCLEQYYLTPVQISTGCNNNCEVRRDHRGGFLLVLHVALKGCVPIESSGGNIQVPVGGGGVTGRGGAPVRRSQ